MLDARVPYKADFGPEAGPWAQGVLVEDQTNFAFVGVTQGQNAHMEDRGSRIEPQRRAQGLFWAISHAHEYFQKFLKPDSVGTRKYKLKIRIQPLEICIFRVPEMGI
jgi:hypothetical protein